MSLRNISHLKMCSGQTGEIHFKVWLGQTENRFKVITFKRLWTSRNLTVPLACKRIRFLLRVKQEPQKPDALTSYNSQRWLCISYRWAINLLGGPVTGYRSFARYNRPINFLALSLDKMHHVVQNRTKRIRQYTPSDLISVARFYKQVQNKRRKSPFQF